MSDALFVFALLCTAGGYFCAGVLWGHQDYAGKFEEGMKAMDAIYERDGWQAGRAEGERLKNQHSAQQEEK